MKATEFMQVNEETKLVTITRREIPPGYQMVQSNHSTADIVYHLAFHSKESEELLHRWKKESNSIITLSIENEEELHKLYEKFKDKLNIIKFYEPDIDAYTSIAFIAGKSIRKKLSHLPLALKNVEEKIKEKI